MRKGSACTTSKTGLGRLCLPMKRHKFTKEIMHDGPNLYGSVNIDIAQWPSLIHAYDLAH